ncbi:MAG: hypothetical protein ACHQ6V_19900 [Myxococcota bacterium]
MGARDVTGADRDRPDARGVAAQDLELATLLVARDEAAQLTGAASAGPGVEASSRSGSPSGQPAGTSATRRRKRSTAAGSVETILT